VDAGDELVLMERLGEIVVRTEAETLYLVLGTGHAGQDQDRRLDLRDAERPQNFIARHVGEVQIEKNDVVVIELAEVDALFAEIRRINVEILGFEHQLDALRSCAVVFDQKYAHVYSPALALEPPSS
jgi:predicted GTPase